MNGVYFRLRRSYPELLLCQSHRSGVTVSLAMSASIHVGRGPCWGSVPREQSLTSGFLHSRPGQSGLTAMIRDLTLNTAGDFCPLRVENGTKAKRRGTELLPDAPALNLGSFPNARAGSPGAVPRLTPRGGQRGSGGGWGGPEPSGGGCLGVRRPIPGGRVGRGGMGSQSGVGDGVRTLCKARGAEPPYGGAEQRGGVGCAARRGT